MRKVAAVILLAGRSERFVSNTPKQFFLISNKPLIYFTILSFELNPEIDEITLVARKEDIEKVAELVRRTDFKKITALVEGGETRSKSVKNGLASLKLKDDDLVLIHDGARPVVPQEVIHNVIKALDSYNAVTAAIRMEDTIAISHDGKTVDSFENRDNYFRIQTPQGFKYKTIMLAHKNANSDATDDAQLAKAIGEKVGVVIGDKKMIKVTTIDDVNNVESAIKDEHLLS